MPENEICTDLKSNIVVANCFRRIQNHLTEKAGMSGLFVQVRWRRRGPISNDQNNEDQTPIQSATGLQISNSRTCSLRKVGALT